MMEHVGAEVSATAPTHAARLMVHEEKVAGVTAHRLASFSDAVLAVIMTVLVLDLRAPERPAFSALLPLWPTVISYSVSYLFIAIFRKVSHRARRVARRRSLTVLAIFAAAVLVAFVAPRMGLALVCIALLLHLRPEGLRSRTWARGSLA